jgi:hypothetical protein
MTMRKGRLLLLAVPALLLAPPSCKVPPLMEPGSSIFLQANPPFVASNGGVSLVTALLTEPAGTLVPDGTVVYFFASIGRIDPQAKTRDGVARANFVSDSRSGQATITAFSGGAAPAPSGGSASGGGGSTVTITIGNALPTLVIVTASPERVRGPGSTTLRANVFDANGNPVANTPVIFKITATVGGTPLPTPTPPATPLPGPAPEETLDSGGGQVFTDNNGQAFDTLRTRSIAGVSAPKIVTVTARTANDKSGTVDIAIN